MLLARIVWGGQSSSSRLNSACLSGSRSTIASVTKSLLPGQLRQIGGGGDPAQRFLGPRLTDQFALDEELQRMGDVGLGPGKYTSVEVADDGRVAPQCEVDGDAEPHGPAADDADGFDIG